MIEPVVFPFTFLDADTAGMLLACFNCIRVYIPTDSARDEFAPDVLENNRVDICNPFSDNGFQVDHSFREYRQWRQANMGTDISFFKAMEGNIPFFDENTISCLRQDILRSVPGASEKTTDMLLAARVFLRMTGNYDSVQAEIMDSLLIQKEKELSMLAALQGEDDEEPLVVENASPSGDAGELMTTERLNAWSMLAAHDNPLPAVFLTPSRTVFQAVMDHFDNPGIVLENIPVPGDCRHPDPAVGEQWRNDLAGLLSDLQQNPHVDPGNRLTPSETVDKNGIFLTVAGMTGVSPRYFLEKLHPKTNEGLKSDKVSDPLSTVVMALLRA